MAMNQKKTEKVSDPHGSGLQWYFPTTGHGENDGFNDSQLEYFQGDHEKYIAREMIQNAIDARLDYKNPISIIFERFSIPANSLPGHGDFLERMNRCLEFVAGQENAELFFKSAIALIKGKELPILKVSDFNTFGLSGLDDDKNGNWYRLVKATGTSSIKGYGGGTFGIGKGAPIAASRLRTVFYSSINDKGEAVFQGKARLVSHYDETQDVRRGVGFYGINGGHQSLRSNNLIPAIFRRQDRGTDIFIMGYTSNNDWQQKLIKSVLHNFWLAIWHGDLEVIVKDGSEKIIKKENLKECLEEYDAEDAKFFFEAVTNRTQEFKQNLKHLGEVALFVRKQENYPGKIMMVRKPKMLVQEKQYRVLREPYAGVFICDTDKGNELLRSLEPPAHDNWDKARAKNGWIALRELDDFIKQSLRSMGEAITSQPQDIPGLDRYLPDNEDRDYEQEDGADALSSTELIDENESGREVGAVKEPEETEVDKVVRKGVVTSKFSAPIKPGPTGKTGGGGGLDGRPTGRESGNEQGARIKTATVSFRSFVQQSESGLEYHCLISGREDCEGAIRIVAVGDDGNYPVDLKSAVDAVSGKSYETKNSMIDGLSIKNGKTLKLAVRLSTKKKYTLGIESYEG